MQLHSESSDSDGNHEIDAEDDKWLIDKTEPTDDGAYNTQSSTASAVELEDEETNPSKFSRPIEFAQTATEMEYSTRKAKLRYLLMCVSLCVMFRSE